MMMTGLRKAAGSSADQCSPFLCRIWAYEFGADSCCGNRSEVHDCGSGAKKVPLGFAHVW